MQTEWSFHEFQEYVDRIATQVGQCLSNSLPLAATLDGESEPICMKSPELRIVYCNPAFQQLICQGNPAGGRHTELHLQESIAPIARATDHVILAGSRRVLVDHVGIDAQGRTVLFRTEKRSLMASEHVNYAILSVTHIQSLLEPEKQDAVRHRNLLSHWSRFRQLDTGEREIAVCLARGMSPAEIAELQGVSKRTIELHRSAILNLLGLPQPVDLVKLLVRLQENGLEDLRV